LEVPLNRLFVLLSVLFFALSSAAFAGGNEDPCSYPGHKEDACPPDQGDVPGKPGHDHPGHGHPGHGHPGHGHPHGLCAGGFQGFYGNGFPIAFMVRPSGKNQVQVQAWYGGMTYLGTGICSQLNAWQAGFEFYFPGAPVHRGVISTNGYGSTMQGHLDFHYGFQLQRTR
jgi:hypothetical protein